MKKILILVIVLTMIMSMSVYTFANELDTTNQTEENEEITNDDEDGFDTDEEEDETEENELKGKKTEKKKKKTEKEVEKKAIEIERKTEEIIKKAIKQMKNIDKEIAKIEKMQARVNMRIKALEKYSNIELEDLKCKAEEIKTKYSGITPIDVDRIVSRTKKFKFDTPPVIKEGRTLVPVRAMLEAYGADVSWSKEEKEVTIIISGDTIKLKIDNISAYVNGEKVELDVPAKIINARTVVPLRFVLESLGYEIEYEEETGTIEIIDDEDIDEEEDVDSEDETEDTDEIDEDEEDDVDDTDSEDQAEETDEDNDDTEETDTDSSNEDTNESDDSNTDDTQQ